MNMFVCTWLSNLVGALGFLTILFLKSLRMVFCMEHVVDMLLSVFLRICDYFCMFYPFEVFRTTRAATREPSGPARPEFEGTKGATTPQGKPNSAAIWAQSFFVLLLDYSLPFTSNVSPLVFFKTEAVHGTAFGV